jgi:hypothetical protein
MAKKYTTNALNRLPGGLRGPAASSCISPANSIARLTGRLASAVY